MEFKFVIPNMEKTFGSLEFAGEDKTEQRRINGRMTVQRDAAYSPIRSKSWGFSLFPLYL